MQENKLCIKIQQFHVTVTSLNVTVGCSSGVRADHLLHLHLGKTLTPSSLMHP